LLTEDLQPNVLLTDDKMLCDAKLRQGGQAVIFSHLREAAGLL
jgi:hypothetical protein